VSRAFAAKPLNTRMHARQFVLDQLVEIEFPVSLRQRAAAVRAVLSFEREVDDCHVAEAVLELHHD